ncbi:MAG TPA: DUF5335 family protein [Tepidisphaeraceae bacterium]|nr:DUF5335 family protein [Tepidisphaeraceae bacterium]
MQTREIPIEQWEPFFNSFSECHQGEKVTVKIVGKDIGDQTEMCDMPLMGISADRKAGGGERIEVSAGETTSAHITHAVLHPSHVRLAESDDGQAIAMQIESDDGPVTLVRFSQDPQELPEGFLSA